MKTIITLSLAIAGVLASTGANAQRVRSMYGVEGASTTTTQSTPSPLDGNWVGSVNRKEGSGTRSMNLVIRNAGSGSASFSNNGDPGTARVSGNSMSFGNRNPMTVTFSGKTATVTGTYDNGVAVNGTLRRQ